MWLTAVTGAGVNWWHNACWKTGCRGRRSQDACVAAMHLSSPAWTDFEATETLQVWREGADGSTPVSLLARERSWIEGMVDAPWGWTLRAHPSSSSYPLCTLESCVLRTEAAERCCCLDNESEEKQNQSGAWTENWTQHYCFPQSCKAPENAGRTGPH